MLIAGSSNGSRSLRLGAGEWIARAKALLSDQSHRSIARREGRFAEAVAEEVRHAKAHDPFYSDKDPRVFGRAVVGAVSDAVGYFLTHPGADAESLAGSLCQIFAPCRLRAATR